MPLILALHPTFNRIVRKLDPQHIKIVGRILNTLEMYYQSNCRLEITQQNESRFFYKKLKKSFYEAGVESKLRVVVRRDGSKCQAIFVGNHDQIKRFLSDH